MVNENWSAVNAFRYQFYLLTYFHDTSMQEGFWYHHAEPKYLMLVYWIPESPSTIPANATHRVGVGSFVMNEKQEVFPHHQSQYSATS